MRKTKKKKSLRIVIIAIAIFMSLSVVLYATGTIIPNAITLEFNDENLYNAIKNKFKSDKIIHNSDDEFKTIEVSKDNVEAITELNLEGTEDAQIKDLSGLENFEELKILNLSGNSITQMSNISSLTKLEKLNMTGNQANTNILETIKELATLKELDMTSTKMNGDQLNNFKSLQNINTLILSNNNISNLEPIAILNNITKLDISKNTSFTAFDQLISHSNLVELNISGTGISTLQGIDRLTNLEKLYASNMARITDTNGIKSLYATYKHEETKKDIPYLDKIKVLNLNNLGISGSRPSINFNNFKILTTLTELHLASNDISSLTNLAKLENIEYINLANNKIDSKDIENFIQYETIDGVKVVSEKNTLKASKIELQGNEIIDISVFASYPGNIKHLDLSRNHIYNISPLANSKHTFSEALYLQNQNITFGIYDKNVAGVDHYIILPTLFKYSQTKGSLVYSENAKLEYTGVTLNPAYTEPSQYNVIIESTKTKDDILTVEIKGGAASGSILNFKLGTKTGAHVDCLIESLLFVDENLDRAIYEDLMSRYINSIKYLERVPKIININQDVISKVGDFNLQHTASTESTKIKDLTGIENFYNLKTLYLQDNNLSTIKQLSACKLMEYLNLANNPNIKDNNSAIESMTKLKTLDLSNTGMTNIDSINNLTNILTNSKKSTTLTVLNIPGNGLTNIDGLEKIKSLQKLDISNENLETEDIYIIQDLTNLETLNMSGNQIDSIEVLKDLTNIKYLYFNNNKVQSLEPIDGKIFYELEFSNNRIKDIKPLYAHHSINNLNMNNNYIENVEVLSNISISAEQKFSATGQKIVRVLEKGSKGNVTIELPQIFKAAQDSTSKVYTNSNLILSKCTLDETKTKVIINVEELKNDIAQVSIYGGKANNTVLTIAAPLEAYISYNPSNETITNKNITATITFNRSEVTITNNGGKNTYTFSENGEFTFKYFDKYGFEGEETVKITNIDKVAPAITGVKEGEKYKEAVKPIIKDDNLGTVTLTKDGTAVANYKPGNKIEEPGKYVLTANDLASNTTKISFEIEELSDIITSTKYTVNEKEKTISGIIPQILGQKDSGTTAVQLKQNIKVEMSYEILDKDGNALSDMDCVGTGYQIKMKNGKVYQLVVRGDVNGDAKMNGSDLLSLARKIIYLEELSGIYLQASDVNMNGKVSQPNDLLVMSRIIIQLEHF